MRARVAEAPRLSTAQGALAVLEALRTPRTPQGPHPRELADVDAGGLEELRETGVGQAFEIERAELSRDGRFLRVHLGPPRSPNAAPRPTAAPNDLCDSPAPRIGQTQGHGPSSDPGRETTPILDDAARMAAILSEPHPVIRATMLVLEHGFRNRRSS